MQHVVTRLSFVAAALLSGLSAPAQDLVPSPKQFLGHDIGEDYFLASYTQLVRYWRQLEEKSDRLVIEEIGKTSYGQKMIMAIISSPENLALRDEYRRISKRLCLAEGVDDAQAKQLAAKGKPIIWIDGGLHATETVAGQNIIELVYRMCNGTDSEVRRILDNVILLVCPANPDGMEMVANAYMATRRIGGLPVLYQRYVGHDNNRDFYASNQVESAAINRVLFREWYPQVVYNHHQTAPRGTIIFTPPFRDPFNYNIDPLVIRGIDLVATHMNNRFARENKPGVISRSGASYSTWWNGGLRTTTYYHNMIGILTEVFGSPNPSRVRQTVNRRVPFGDYPMPIATQEWHARQTIEYLQTANFAILDLASRYGEELLWTFWRMGRNGIERGSRDHWTPTPKLAELARAQEGNQRGRGADDASADREARVDPFSDPALRDPRGYVLPADQPDFAAATHFVNTLIKAGIEVQRATADFEAGGTRYPKGSYVVQCAQAFRAHVLDMFEPQWHPDDIGSSGQPVRPYDSAGWTLALQMDVGFARILDGFAGPFERIEGFASRPSGTVGEGAAGWLVSHADSASYRVTNRLLGAGVPVYWLDKPAKLGGRNWPAGTVFVPRSAKSAKQVAALANDTGVAFHGVEKRPSGAAWKLRKPRIGLFDGYGGNIATGWAEWVMKQFDFPVELVFGKRIVAGDLDKDYDVLVFLTGLPSARQGRGGGRRRGQRGQRSQRTAEDVAKVTAALPPFEDWSTAANRLVRLTRDNATKPLRKFVNRGGTVIAIGNQARTAISLFELPVHEGVQVQDGKTGKLRPATGTEFFIPGSLIRVDVDTKAPLAWGCSQQIAAMFRRSPTFTTTGPKATVVASYSGNDTLVSGWAIGEDLIKDRAAVLTCELGKGRVHLYGADVLYRGQPWGTFKLVFNGILAAAATRVRALGR